MKKLITALFTVLLASMALVGFTTTQATAANCPYTGCIPTSMSLSCSVNGKFVTVTANVTAAGNGQPRGTVSFVADRLEGSGYRTRNSSVSGASQGVKMKLRKAGTWDITATYNPNGDSIYESSSASCTVTIRQS